MSPHYTESEKADSDDDFDAMSVSSVPSSIASTTYHSSNAMSVRSPSPSGSVWSMSSSLRASAYREEYGRYINNYSDVYRLPADGEELERLQNQHMMLVQAMKGKYPPAMAEVMEQSYPGDTKTCVDLGCGSGDWIIDVARDFPHCECVGVDLVPMQSTQIPLNCRSEVDDVNLGLDHFYNQLDVVHARLIAMGIKDYKKLIDEMARSLKPRGLIEVVEFDFHIYDRDRNRIELSSTELQPPWWPRWITLTREAAKTFGGHVEAATHVYDWINEHPAFEGVTYREFWISCCPWTVGDPWQQAMGRVMRDDILAFIKSARPMLLDRGHTEQVINFMTENTRRELMEGSHTGWVRIQSTHARRKTHWKAPPKQA